MSRSPKKFYRTPTREPLSGSPHYSAGETSAHEPSTARSAVDFRPRQTRYPFTLRVHFGLNLSPLRLVLPLVGVNISATGLLAAFRPTGGGTHLDLDEVVRLLEVDSECQLQLDVPDNNLPIPTVTASLQRIALDDGALGIGMRFRAYTPELMDLITFLDHQAREPGGSRREKL